MDQRYHNIDRFVDEHADALRNLARALHDEPELAYNEHKSVARISTLLEQHGASVQRPLGGLDTAFRARIGDGSGPHVAILAEYDALPEIGHACGHNLIAAGAVGAWLALGQLEVAGTVDLIGTPAEEGGGGKIRLADAGVFEGVDAAMMYHPFDRDLLMHIALASSWVEMEFRGTPAHAAVAPHSGSSALTACMDTFRLVDGQRVHFRDGVRVHGFIKHGGDAVNIIPERAVCEFSVRALAGDELERVVAIVERCARGAAMGSGVDVTLKRRQGYLDMRNNEPLALRFGEHLEALGRTARVTDPSVGAGSTDMGDVSHRVPSIHPWLAICNEGETTCHEHAFAECAADERGFSSMLMAAKTMARTALDVVADNELRDQARRHFEP